MSPSCRARYWSPAPRVRRQPPARPSDRPSSVRSGVVGWHRPGRMPPRPARGDDGRLSTFWIDRGHRRDRAPEASHRVSLRRRRSRRPGVGTHGSDIRGERPRHAPSARRARSGRRGGARAHSELGARLPAGDRAADRRSSARPDEPVWLEQARAGARWEATSAPGVQVTIARAFNHFGPRQDPAFSTSGFARQIAAIEAGLQPPEIVVGNLEARRDLTDVRDTVRAYAMIAERGRPGGPTTCAPAAPWPFAKCWRCSSRARASRSACTSIPARFRPNDVPLLLGDPAADPRGAGMDAGGAARADRGRHPRLLARRHRRGLTSRRRGRHHQANIKRMTALSISAPPNRPPGGSPTSSRRAAPPRSPKPKRAPTRPAIRRSPAARRSTASRACRSTGR